ncbi:hypothetical protein ACEPAF_7892 [Sanghuangporus sanghuang]
MHFLPFVVGGINITYLSTSPKSASIVRLHVISAQSTKAIVENPTSFAIGHPHKSHPYLFAFGGRDGSVKIWSILTNNSLEDCQSAEDFEVRDRRNGPGTDPVISTGRFLTLPRLQYRN